MEDNSGSNSFVVLIVVLAAFVSCIIIFLLGAGTTLSVVGNQQSGYSRTEYQAAPGNCFVPPQGDPLWDQHYAEHVNPGNCTAFKDQEQAKIPGRIGGIFKNAFLTVVSVGILFIIGFIAMVKATRP